MVGTLIQSFDSILFGLYWGVAVLALAAARAFRAAPSAGHTVEEHKAHSRAWVVVAILLILLALGRDVLPGVVGTMDADDANGSPLTTYLMLAGVVAIPLLGGAVLLFRQAGDAALIALCVLILLIVQLFLRVVPVGGSNAYFLLEWHALRLSDFVELLGLFAIALVTASRPRAKTRWISPHAHSHRRRPRTR